MKTLNSERLTMKMYSLDDAEGLYGYASNPNVGPHAGWAPHKDVEESEEIIRTLFMPAEAWAIRFKGEDRIIGTISLEPDKYRPDANSREMGYSLAEDQWGKGIMTEAAMTVLEFAFTEMGLDQVGICTSRVNQRSKRVIEKCGFTYEGTIRRAYRIWDGTTRDSVVFSMLKEEWINR